MGVPGGSGVAIALGDLLISNEGELEHTDPDGVYKQTIYTRSSFESDGSDLFNQTGGLVTDGAGSIYVCHPELRGAVGSATEWDGPQIEKFDNTANSLGRWDDSIYQDTIPTGGTTGLRIAPLGIIILSDNTFIAISVVDPPGSAVAAPNTLRVHHIANDGTLIEEWDVDTFPNVFSPTVNAVGDASVAISCDGKTIFYTAVNSAKIGSFDISTGTQLTPFIDMTGTGQAFRSHLIMLKNDVLITVRRETSAAVNIVAYDSSGIELWTVTTTTAGAGGRAAVALVIGAGDTFYIGSTKSGPGVIDYVSQYSTLNGSFIQTFAKQSPLSVGVTSGMARYTTLKERCGGVSFIPMVTLIGAT